MLEARCRLAFDVSPTKCPRTSKRELGDVDMLATVPREKQLADIQHQQCLCYQTTDLLILKSLSRFDEKHSIPSRCQSLVMLCP